MANEVESNFIILDLHYYALCAILEYLPLKDLAAFGSTCKTARETVRQIKLKHVDLREYYNLNAKTLLAKTPLTNIVCLNLNHCYFLSHDTILKLLLTQTNVKHLHIIECRMTIKTIATVANLKLQSLSISWTNNWLNHLEPFLEAKSNSKQPVLCFPTLKHLEVFYPTAAQPVHFHVKRLGGCVLKHCKSLQSLKLYEYSNCEFCAHEPRMHLQYSQKLIATPLPNLKNINVDFVDCPDLTVCIFDLLESILPENGVPLENVDLGRQSIHLLYAKFPVHKLRLLQRSSTFCLSPVSRFQTKPLLREWFWGAREHVRSMLGHSNYRKFYMKNLQFSNFIPIAHTIVTNSRNTIEAIDFAGSRVLSGLCEGLQLITTYCSQIKVLDVTFIDWKFTKSVGESALDAIANLKYLEQLHLTPFQIGCKKNVLSTNNRFDHHPNIPSRYDLWKVTKHCKNLSEIRIVNHQKQITCVVHEDTLVSIAMCENLKAIHLGNFYTYGNESAIPKITTGCTKLETLYITKITNNNKLVNVLATNEFLKNAKSIKELSFIQNVRLDRSFIDALCSCEKLEKINLERITINPKDCFLFRNSISKLKNLWTFRIKCDEKYINHLYLFDELIKRKRWKPAFVFSLENFGSNYKKKLYQRRTIYFTPSYLTPKIPFAHLHMQKYSYL